MASDSLNLLDVTKFVEELCAQLSMSHVTVPKIDTENI